MYATENYSWMFYPPPFEFLSPTCPPSSGLSGCGCGGTCGGCGNHGLGLFESGLDYTQWGVGEWAAVGVVALIAVKALKKRKGRR